MTQLVREAGFELLDQWLEDGPSLGSHRVALVASNLGVEQCLLAGVVGCCEPSEQAQPSVAKHAGPASVQRLTADGDVRRKMEGRQNCNAAVGHLIFVEDASVTLEDHARLMYQRIQELRLPTWLSPEAFHTIIDPLTDQHCRPTPQARLRRLARQPQPR